MHSHFASFNKNNDNFTSTLTIMPRLIFSNGIELCKISICKKYLVNKPRTEAVVSLQDIDLQTLTRVLLKIV